MNNHTRGCFATNPCASVIQSDVPSRSSIFRPMQHNVKHPSLVLQRVQRRPPPDCRNLGCLAVSGCCHSTTEVVSEVPSPNTPSTRGSHSRASSSHSAVTHPQQCRPRLGQCVGRKSRCRRRSIDQNHRYVRQHAARIVQCVRTASAPTLARSRSMAKHSSLFQQRSCPTWLRSRRAASMASWPIQSEHEVWCRLGFGRPDGFGSRQDGVN